MSKETVIPVTPKRSFTIYDTLTMKVERDGKELPFEVWIVDDDMMDYGEFQKHPDHLMALARLLTKEAISELGLKAYIKHPGVEAVGVIRKSVADLASDYELENLILHEAAHMALGHTGLDTEREEKEVREEIGEAEISNDLFGIRYMALRNMI